MTIELPDALVERSLSLAASRGATVEQLLIDAVELEIKLASFQGEFLKLARQWREETGHLSSIERKVLHPAYQRIIAMGFGAVPFVLRELERNGGHWFWALHFMTGINQVERARTIKEARSAWLAWGQEQGHLARAIA